MAWIKRNLFFAIGAVIAVGLLAVAGVYGYKNWHRNEAALTDLNQAYATLRHLNDEKPLPGNDRINNIEAARKQERQLRRWIRRAGRYFRPISPVPDPTNGPITDAAFAAARDHTLNQLLTDAAKASVTLPPQYGFSFEAERTLVKFAPNSLQALAQQLGEVKAICEILFAAKVNSLDDIRRVEVSPDDKAGPQSDYLSVTAVTNQLAIFTPYQVTFRCFSQNLAKVLASLATSPHGFIVSGINVQPASAAATASSTPSGVQGLGQMPPSYNTPNTPQRARFAPRLPRRSRGGLQTVLNEQLLRITLEIKIVKLLPGK